MHLFANSISNNGCVLDEHTYQNPIFQTHKIIRQGNAKEAIASQQTNAPDADRQQFLFHSMFAPALHCHDLQTIRSAVRRPGRRQPQPRGFIILGRCY